MEVKAPDKVCQAKVTYINRLSDKSPAKEPTIRRLQLYKALQP
jgi:hypothetical protein